MISVEILEDDRTILSINGFGCLIRRPWIDFELHWYVRDVGDYLGFGSGGGNLSRYVRSRWKMSLRPMNRHRKGFRYDYRVGPRRAILLTGPGLECMLRLILADKKALWPVNCERRAKTLLEYLES